MNKFEQLEILHRQYISILAEPVVDEQRAADVFYQIADIGYILRCDCCGKRVIAEYDEELPEGWLAIFHLLEHSQHGRLNVLSGESTIYCPDHRPATHFKQS